jgi:uncharacterized membrane protein (DUF106 family)
MGVVTHRAGQESVAEGPPGQATIRDLNREIRTARATGDFEKVERLQEQRKKLLKDEPC